GAQTLVVSSTPVLTAGGTIRPTGALEWTSGYMAGGTLTNNGTVRLTGGSGSRGLNGAVLRNQGTVEHTDSGIFYIYNGGRAENAAAWNAAGEGDLYGSSGTGTFVNEAGGTFTKSGAGTTTQFVAGGLVVENAGTMHVASGILRFDRPSTHTDAVLTTAADATLFFASQPPTFVGTVTGAQNGVLNLATEFAAGADAEWAFTGLGLDWTSGYFTSGTLVNTGL